MQTASAKYQIKETRYDSVSLLWDLQRAQAYLGRGGGNVVVTEVEHELSNRNEQQFQHTHTHSEASLEQKENFIGVYSIEQLRFENFR